MLPRKAFPSPVFWCQFRASWPSLVPVTFAMHNFWAVKDPMMQQIQMAMFLKNIFMLGSALSFAQMGTGPLSLDSRGGR